MKIISSLSVKLPAVALTFDDGPHETLTEKFIELFAREGARGTFFELGGNVEKFPEQARRLVENGHEVGNHSYTHPHLPQLDEEEIRKQLRDTHEMILRVTGVAPKVFRAPYLDQDEKVGAILEEFGLPSIGANRRTEDWSQESTVEEIISRSVDGIQPGDIVVLHTWQAKTYDAMPEILRRIKSEGLSCVTISELMTLAEL